MVKLSHFQQYFWIFAPSDTHFAPSVPPTKKQFLVPPLVTVAFFADFPYAYSINNKEHEVQWWKLPFW